MKSMVFIPLNFSVGLDIFKIVEKNEIFRINVGKVLFGMDSIAVVGNLVC